MVTNPKPTSLQDQLASDLLKTAGLTSTLPPDILSEYQQLLSEQITERMANVLSASMDEATLAAYEKLLARTPPPTPSEQEQFLRLYVPNYATKIADELKKLTQTFLQSVAKNS